MAIAAPVELPWLALPELESVNTYWTPPVGAIKTPAIVYRADSPWIEKRQTYRSWLENYVAVCVVQASAGSDGVARLYQMALELKAAIDADPALSSWEWKEVEQIVETEQAGLSYLACAVRLSFTAATY